MMLAEEVEKKNPRSGSHCRIASNEGRSVIDEFFGQKRNHNGRQARIKDEPSNEVGPMQKLGEIAIDPQHFLRHPDAKTRVWMSQPSRNQMIRWLVVTFQPFLEKFLVFFKGNRDLTGSGRKIVIAWSGRRKRFGNEAMELKDS